MTTISNVKVYDLKESVIACRNAMRIEMPEYTDDEFNNSLKRAIACANSPSGSGEQTFLSGIRVSFDIRYPNYLSPELQRYHWIDIVQSSSKMHKLTKMNMDCCFNEYVTLESKAQMEELIEQHNLWVESLAMGNYTEEEKESIRRMIYKSFMMVISNCPQGIELFMRVSTNYLQLKTIYRQRKHHKLKEDWGAVCKMIESLPYAEEFLLGKSKNEPIEK